MSHEAIPDVGLLGRKLRPVVVARQQDAIGVQNVSVQSGKRRRMQMKIVVLEVVKFDDVAVDAEQVRGSELAQV